MWSMETIEQRRTNCIHRVVFLLHTHAHTRCPRMYIVKIYLSICTLATFTGSEEVTWLTAYNRCRNDSVYLKRVNPSVYDYWLPEFTVTAYFLRIGCYNDQQMLLHKTVSSTEQCYWTCARVTHSYMALRSSVTLSCGCLSEQDIQQKNRVTCGSDSAVRVYEEINYTEYNMLNHDGFYVNYLEIDCDDRRRECMDLKLWSSDKVTIKCKYITPRTTIPGLCTNTIRYQCEDVRTEVLPRQTTTPITTTTITTTTLSTTSLEQELPTTRKSHKGGVTTIYTNQLDWTDSTVKDIVQDNVTNGANITNKPNTTINTSAVDQQGIKILPIALAVVLAVVCGVGFSILLIWILRKKRFEKNNVPFCYFINKNSDDTDSNQQRKNFDQKEKPHLASMLPTNDHSSHINIKSDQHKKVLLNGIAKYEIKDMHVYRNLHFENYNSNSPFEETYQQSAALSEPYNTISFGDAHDPKDVNFKHLCLPQNYDHIDINRYNSKVQNDQIPSEYDKLADITRQIKLDHGDYDHLNMNFETLTDSDFTYSSGHFLDIANSDYDTLGLEGHENEITYFDSIQHGGMYVNNDIVAGKDSNYKNVEHDQ